MARSASPEMLHGQAGVPDAPLAATLSERGLAQAMAGRPAPVSPDGEARFASPLVATSALDEPGTADARRLARTMLEAAYLAAAR